MFKKLKDKLAEEVKSSPQRIQQIAQAAQAAVTSASSSISDITNSDLFSIGDNDSQSAKSQVPLNSQQKPFQDVSLVQPLQSSPEAMDYSISSHDILDNQRQRRLSNSSFASDVSFRLPSYETPSMYHLQSDMEVSASEAEERGFASGAVSLDRVTKEQLYAAYRRTQERYTKYRTQYGDLARHYKLLERENAKARSVLVETQDKALRRISELREQCSLEQSAKAHLEKALRVEIEEKIMKIEALNTKVQLLQSSSDVNSSNDNTENIPKTPADDGDVHLINLSNDIEVKQLNHSAAEVLVLNNKIEKMEQLLNKYKDSLKTSKEKNSQVNTELQIMVSEVESKNKEIEELKLTTAQLAEAKHKIQEYTSLNEELQNKINVYEFNKTREQSTLEADYQKALEEIKSLHNRIEVFVKREEENAISLAENKLSIHKELESKEAEIRSLKDNLDACKKEVQSLNIVVSDYKKNLSSLEGERSKLMHDSTELTSSKSKITDMAAQIEDLSKKCQGLEQSLSKSDESYKCLQLQMKQETAEKLAMIDRNVYLENRNTQLSDENAKKSNQICNLESELHKKEKAIKSLAIEDSKKHELLEELSLWKDKYAKLESEIQEERDELIKLQSEIEKMFTNHELLQSQNVDFRKLVSDLKSENASLQERLVKTNKIKSSCLKIANDINDIKSLTKLVSNDAKSLQIINNQAFLSLVEQINYTLNNALQSDNNLYSEIKKRNSTLQQELQNSTVKYDNLFQQFNLLQDENNKLKSRMSQLESQKANIDEQVKNITNQYEIAIHELNSVKVENENYSHKVNEFENNILNLQTAIEIEKKQNLDSQIALEFEKKQYLDLQIAFELEKKPYMDAIEKLKILEIEKQSLVEKIECKEGESNLVNKELDALRDQYRTNVEELKMKQYLDLQTAIELEKKQYLDLQTALELEKKQYLDAIEKIKMLEFQKQSLLETIECKEGESNLVNEELDALRDQYRSNVEELNTVKSENANLREEIKRKDDTITDINNLQDEKKALTLENISLRSRAESIANSYKLLETEISDVRKAHAEIVLEKDHLSEIIERLESSSKTTLDQDSQTENTGEKQVTENILDVVEQSRLDENVNDEIERNIVLHLQESKPLQNNNNNELSNKYLSLKTEYDILKEENRRFRSDIEGLQTYLTKISKENSMLNDKLRELIATSEHSTDNNVLADLLELKNELQSSKEKIDDLLRENSLLIEENLELKDQLQTQNYPHTPHQSDAHSTNDKEISLIKEKYNSLLQANSILEKQVTDLELTNRSVHGNITQTQEKNEKLRLTNEKLERRLDEALVSLRHLHSLQENTELEYLRNILYEYLTGSGLHSVTLAKVLAAIVKFDDMQTKLVLQKEKERQGFLRQLGII